MKSTKPVICWWSGGVTSAVACKLELDRNIYCRIIFMDTENEDRDTYRFKDDCEKWYQQEIETITAVGDKFDSIEEVWDHYKLLNPATGAICSSELKRDLRLKFEKENDFRNQVFGFDINEAKRAKGMKANHSRSKPIFSLLHHALRKEDCFQILKENGIKPPRAYEWGFQNNNCLQTLCVQGGIGYYQKAKSMGGEWVEKVYRMAMREHKYTNQRGRPVTILKDQSDEAKASGFTEVFLEKHPDYPNHKCLDDMEGRPVKPLMECNGFCGTNDFERNETEKEINFFKDDYQQIIQF